MTGPRLPNLEPRYGPGSAWAQQEWERRNRMLDEAFEDIMRSLGLGGVRFGEDSAGSSRTWDDQTQPPLQSEQGPLGGLLNLLFPQRPDDIPEDRERLLAAAEYWQIPNFERMSNQMLAQEVERRRTASIKPESLSRRAKQAHFNQLFGLSLIESLSGIVEDVPFIGGTVAKAIGSERAQAWARRLQEGVAAQLPQEDRGFTGAGAARFSGAASATLLPFTGAWKLAGAAGRVAGLTRLMKAEPISRAAIQGGASTWFLRGGSNPTAGPDYMERANEIAFGAALSGLFEFGGQAIGGLIAQRAASRVNQSFRAKSTSVGPVRTVPRDGFSDIPEADYIILGGELPRAPRQLPAPPPQLPQSPVRSLPAGPGPVTPEPPTVGVGPFAAGPVRSGVPALPAQVVPPLEAPGALPVQRRLPAFTTQRPFVQTQSDLLYDAFVAGGEPLPIGPLGQRVSFGVSQAQKASQRPIVREPRFGVLRGSRVADDSGAPLVVYHGTRTPFEGDFDPTKADPEALFGPAGGGYHTEEPDISSGYAGFDPFDIRAILAHVNELDIENEQILANRQMLLDQGITPQQIDQDLRAIDAARKTVLNRLFASPGAVRPSYLRIERPYDVDAQVNPVEASHIVDVGRSMFPSPMWDDVLAAVRTTEAPFMGPMGGEEFYNRIVDTIDQIQRQEINELAAQYGLARRKTNELLEVAGYDGITYIGGHRTNHDPHRVWMAFRPDQVVPVFSRSLTQAEAVDDAIALTKQATILESPTLPDDAVKVQLTTTDLVNAALETNRAGVSVIRGVGNLAETVRDLAVARRGPFNYFFVDREGRIDLLVSEGPNLSARRDEYKQFGIFTGMNVVTANGKNAVVVKPGVVSTLVNPYHPKLTFRTKLSNISPGRFGSGGFEAPQQYAEFRAFTEQYMAREAAKADMARVPQWLDAETSEHLPVVLEEFFAAQGIRTPNLQASLEEYFNIRRVQDFKSLVPEEARQMDELVQEAYDAQFQAELELPEPSTLERAASKGFTWVTDPGRRSGTLVDTQSDLKIPVEHEGAAEDFLRNFDRELPDFTPTSSVPLEVAPEVPVDSNIEPSLPLNELADAMEFGAASVEDDITQITRIAIGEPPRAPPPLPPGGPSGAFEPHREPLRLPGGGEIRREFRKLSPIELADIMRRHTGAWTQWGRLTRSSFQKIESDFLRRGVDFPIAQAWDGVEAGLTHQHNHMVPDLRRASTITDAFRTKHLTSGAAVKVHEIDDPIERQAAMDYWGFNEGEQRAINQLKHFMDFMYAQGQQRGVWGPERGFIERYISHSRMREGMPGVRDAWQDREGFLPSSFHFFADNLRRGGMYPRQMDLRWLLTHYIRSFWWAVDVARPMERFLGLARGLPDEAQPIRSLMENWADVVVRGYDVQGDLAVSAIRTLVSKVLRVPITNRQAHHILARGVSLSYWRMLGLDPAPMVREATQPFLSGTKGSFLTLGGVYQDLLTSRHAAEIVERARQGGWYEEGIPSLDVPGSMEATIQTAEGRPLLTPAQQRRVDMAVTLNGLLRDAVPRPLRTLENTRADPLFAYGKVVNLGRIATGEMAYRLVSRAIERYEAFGRVKAGLGTPQDKSLIADMMSSRGVLPDEFPKEQLVSEARLGGFEPAVGNGVWTRVRQGRFQDAAEYAAREFVRETQFVSGVRQLPPKWRTPIGRLTWQLMSFSRQFATFLANGLRHGDPLAKTRFLVGLGTFTAGLLYAKSKTKWDFTPWIFFRAFGNVGGPAVQAAGELVSAGTGAARTITGDYVTPEQRRSMSGVFDNPIMGAANFFNPFGGAFETAARIEAALQAPNVPEALAATLLLADEGQRIHYTRQFENEADRIMDEIFRAQELDTTRAGQPKIGTVNPLYRPGGGSQQ